MSEVFAKYEKEISADSFARGMEASKRAFALRLLEDGVAFERIVQYTDLPLKEVQALAGKQAGES